MAALVLAGASAGAQEHPALGFPIAADEPGPGLLVLDQERLFADSLFGRRVAAEIEQRSRDLAAENRQYEATLEAEERSLTDLRATLGPEEFRARADAFDQRVQRIRQDQDAKARALAVFRESEQQRFLTALRPVLLAIAAERGAVAVLDRRVLLVAAESIDITGETVARVDQVLGDNGIPAEEEAENPDLPAVVEPGGGETPGGPEPRPGSGPVSGTPPGSENGGDNAPLPGTGEIAPGMAVPAPSESPQGN